MVVYCTKKKIVQPCSYLKKKFQELRLKKNVVQIFMLQTVGWKEPITIKLQEIMLEMKGTASKATEEKSLTSSLLFRVEQIVDQRLDELTPVQVKNIIQEMIRKHLGWLVVWGGAVGGFIGLGVSIIQ